MLFYWLFNLFALSGLAYGGYRRYASAPLRVFYLPALGLKLLAGLGLGWLYLYWFPYRGDTFLYAEDTARLASLAGQDWLAFSRLVLGIESPQELKGFALGGQPRAFFLVRLLAPFAVLTGGNYWLLSLWLSGFAFWGLFRLATGLVERWPTLHWAAALAFLFFPSAVFWSAGVGKESVAMGCLGLTLSFLLEPGRRPFRMEWAKRTTKWLFMGVSALVLSGIKFYYLGALVPAVGGLALWQTGISRRLRYWQLGGLVLAFLGLLLGATFLDANLGLNSLLEVILVNHDGIVRASQPEGLIHYSDLRPEPLSVLRNWPLALFSGLFRPLPGDGQGFLSLLVGLENALLLLLFLFTLYRWGRGRLRIERVAWPYVGMAGFYVLLLASCLALSTPNFGTLSRYKVGFLPFWVLLLLLGAGLPDWQRNRKRTSHAH